jgi:hypothetical protein
MPCEIVEVTGVNDNNVTTATANAVTLTAVARALFITAHTLTPEQKSRDRFVRGNLATQLKDHSGRECSKMELYTAETVEGALDLLRAPLTCDDIDIVVVSEYAKNTEQVDRDILQKLRRIKPCHVYMPRNYRAYFTKCTDSNCMATAAAPVAPLAVAPALTANAVAPYSEIREAPDCPDVLSNMAEFAAYNARTYKIPMLVVVLCDTLKEGSEIIKSFKFRSGEGCTCYKRDVSMMTIVASSVDGACQSFGCTPDDISVIILGDNFVDTTLSSSYTLDRDNPCTHPTYVNACPGRCNSQEVIPS